jgi:hypothetical protein
MGRVPIWKLPDLTHEIGNWTHKSCEEGKKRKENHGQKRGCKRNGSGDHFLKRESMCNSLVLKRTEKKFVSGYKNCWATFSNQADKQGCREDE